MPINPTQRRFLLDRLNEISRSHPSSHENVKLPEPASVTAARKIVKNAERVINRYEKTMNGMRLGRNKKIDQARTACRQEIEFGDAKKALAAIERFAKLKF